MTRSRSHSSSSSQAPARAELNAYYRLFGLPPHASAADIHKRYYHLARRWHPDGFVGRNELPLAEAKMKAINGAYLGIKGAPLRAEAKADGRRARARQPVNGTVTAAGTFMAWLRSVEGREPSTPEGSWARPCPNCGVPVPVEGCRYAHCGHCGVGFFPDLEGPHDACAIASLTLRQRLVLIGIYAASAIVHAFFL